MEGATYATLKRVRAGTQNGSETLAPERSGQALQGPPASSATPPRSCPSPSLWSGKGAMLEPPRATGRQARHAPIGPGCERVKVSPGLQRCPQQPTTRGRLGNCRPGGSLLAAADACSPCVASDRSMHRRVRPHPLAALPMQPSQSRPRCPRVQSGSNHEGKEEVEEGAAAAAGRPAGVPEAQKGSDADSNSDQEKEGAYGSGGRLGPSRQGTLSSRSASLRGHLRGSRRPLQPCAISVMFLEASGVPRLEQASRMMLRCKNPAKQSKKGCPTLTWDQGWVFPTLRRN